MQASSRSTSHWFECSELRHLPTRRARNPIVGVLAITILAASGCGTPDDRTPTPTVTDDAHRPHFTDVTRAAGIDHTHSKPRLDPKLDNIMPWVSSVGAAAAAGDVDGDGWIDLYVTTSRKGAQNLLYRNQGDGTFTNVASTAGVADVNDDDGVSIDCIFGDVDDDGWTDLYLVRWGRDRLFLNDGDGTFTEVTRERFTRRDGMPGTDWANGCGAVFLDYDRDGRLDIYVANYFRDVDLWDLTSTRIMHDDFEHSRNGGENFLYHQEPDGTFREVASSLGMEDPGWTLAVGSADVDNDGWLDVYCANDFGPDQLFLNQADGTFSNVSDVALEYDTKKGMNVDFGDVNNDGWLDIYVTNITTAEYLREGNMLWHNNGPSDEARVDFVDIATVSDTYDGGWGWGAKFFDADNDGSLDLVAGNGFISAGEGEYWFELASWTVIAEDPADAANWPAIGERSFSGFEPIRFWLNREGTFVESAAASGLTTRRDERGVVTIDYDNDGDLDLYLANQGQPPCLYRNDTPARHHWLTVALEGRSDAIGARVTVVTPDATRIRERDGGNGYSGQSDPRIHVGLGENELVELVEVRWSDGGLQYLENLPVDQIVTVEQDRARYVASVPRVAAMPERIVLDTAESETPAIDPAELDELLTELETAIRSGDTTLRTTSLYRNRCITYGVHERSVRFFEALVNEHPDQSRHRVNLALAYVDKIPTCGGVAAVVSKGTLARKSLDEVTRVIDHDGGTWLTHYIRGMNHLHWPRALRHSDDAAAEFERCLEIQSAASDPRDYFVRTHVALGDAYAKDGHADRARAVWRAALEHYPDAEAISTRLGITDDDALLDFVEDARSIDRPIDTDMSFVERY